jgi:hypothetical protein
VTAGHGCEHDAVPGLAVGCLYGLDSAALG